METAVSYIVIALIAFALGEWNSRRRRNRYEKLDEEIDPYSPRVQIFVQGGDQDIAEFNSSLREWMNGHKYNPMLDSMVCAQDGRLTVALVWDEEVNEK